MADYTSKGQQRLLAALSAMAGRELDGISPGELAQLTGMSATQVTATLANLQAAGWATRTETGLWKLTPTPVRIFAKVAQNFEQARLRIMNLEQSYLYNQ